MVDAADPRGERDVRRSLAQQEEYRMRDGDAAGRASQILAAMLELQRIRGRLSKVTVADVETVLAAVRSGTHEPGDHHRYRIECEVCGQRGTIRLSIDPDRASSEDES